MNITTTYKTNNNGTGQIVAKANGKQKTVTLDQSKSMDWNHGTAAGALILAKGSELPPQPLVFSAWKHTSNEAGTVHRFYV